MGEPKGNRPLVIPRNIYIWEENIKMDHTKTALESMDWSSLAQDEDKWWALLNMAVNFI